MKIAIIRCFGNDIFYRREENLMFCQSRAPTLQFDLEIERLFW